MRFPPARNFAVTLRDGRWIGGDCVLIREDAIDPLRSAIVKMANARKSLRKVIRLLGPAFTVRFAARRVPVGEGGRGAKAITRGRTRVLGARESGFALY